MGKNKANWALPVSSRIDWSEIRVENNVSIAAAHLTCLFPQDQPLRLNGQSPRNWGGVTRSNWEKRPVVADPSTQTNLRQRWHLNVQPNLKNQSPNNVWQSQMHLNSITIDSTSWTSLDLPRLPPFCLDHLPCGVIDKHKAAFQSHWNENQLAPWECHPIR